MCIIYQALNRINGKSYIGQTIDLKRRKERHRSDALDGSVYYFHRAIRKYGWGAFEWSILYQDDDNDRDWMNWLECRFIKKLGTKAPNGYNMTDGGEGATGLNHTEDAVEKIKEASKRQWQNPKHRQLMSFTLGGLSLNDLHGSEKAEEIRQKQSLVKQGKRQTPEAKQKKSVALSGRSKSTQAKVNMRVAYVMKSDKAKANSSFGILKFNEQRELNGITEQHRQKLVSSHLGKKQSEETRAKMRLAQQRRRQKEKLADVAMA